MIGYITLVRDTGKRAWIRSDEVAAFSENETKVEGKMVPCVTVILRNNVAWHFPDITAEQMVKLIGSFGEQVNVLGAKDL